MPGRGPQTKRSGSERSRSHPGPWAPASATRIWTTAGTDPLANLQKSRAWTLDQLNDFIGDWAMHNVVWDYKATPEAFRRTYGDITLADRPERMRRLMPLEPLDTQWTRNRRFAAPFHGAPQRFGYNVVRLYSWPAQRTSPSSSVASTRPARTPTSEDQAIIANGSVSGGIVGGLSVIGSGNQAFNVSGLVQVRTSFYPLGFFEANQQASGSVKLYGDVEYRGAGLNLAAGFRTGFVDATSTTGSATDINRRTTLTWRP